MQSEMDIVLGSALFTFCCVSVTLIFVFYKRHTRKFDYWKLRKVPFVKPIFPFGSTTDLALARTYIGKGYDKMYHEFANERFFGIIDIQNPMLILRDPELIKSVLLKDFNHFSIVKPRPKNSKEYTSRQVTYFAGQEWKTARHMMSSAVTPAKLKSLYRLLRKCGEMLDEHLKVTTQNGSLVEITDIFARFAFDVISTSAFGLEANSVSNPSCELFQTMVVMLKTTKTRHLRRLTSGLCPKLANVLFGAAVPPKVTDVLTQIVCENITFREENKIRRSDFLDSLMNAKWESVLRQESDKDCSFGLGSNREAFMEQITGHVYGFFIASFATSAFVLCFCLYELSRHQDIQHRLHREIARVLKEHNGEMSYEAIQEMTYLEQIVKEILRLYGSGYTLTRMCTKSYNIPDSNVTLEKGIRVIIPTYSLHHDPQYFPDPYSFQPARFTPERERERHQFVYLPFGEGPRSCVGQNLAMLHMKLGLATVISNFCVDLGPEQEVPLKIDNMSFVATPANPIFLKFTKRK